MGRANALEPAAGCTIMVAAWFCKSFARAETSDRADANALKFEGLTQ